MHVKHSYLQSHLKLVGFSITGVSGHLLPEYGRGKVDLENHKGYLDSSLPSSRSWSDSQLEVKQVHAEMSRQGRVVQVASVQQFWSPFSPVRTGIMLIGAHQKTALSPFSIACLRISHSQAGSAGSSPSDFLLGLAALRTFLPQPHLQELSWEELSGPLSAFSPMSAYGSIT